MWLYFWSLRAPRHVKGKVGKVEEKVLELSIQILWSLFSKKNLYALRTTTLVPAH